MKVGDLVKRNEYIWEHLTNEEIQEVGIITAFDNHYDNEYLDTFEQVPPHPFAIVLWARIGIGYEDVDDLVVVTCKEDICVV